MSTTPKTCFVIMGFGIKTDYRTGKEIDLDKTYKTIIKPAFEELGFVCFRADEIKHSGIIDIPMYEHIIKADFVLADISTLNANVLYELGVRHAVKKFSTLIIAENQLLFPFDLSHIAIDSYEHLGKAIDYEEVLRFREVIKEKVTRLLEKPETDSPLYSFLPDLNAPTFTASEVKKIEKELDNPDASSLSEILLAAEAAKKNKNFEAAKVLLQGASQSYPSSEFLIQKWALVTYKSEEPTKLAALNEAEEILQALKPDQTTDPETLGLAGAIQKRLFEETKKISHLDRALWYYTRGFYVKQDYYNGINVAFLYTLKATLSDDQLSAFGHYGQGQEIRKKVREFCLTLRGDRSFKSRDDQEWVFLTLAETAIGNDEPDLEATYLQEFEGSYSDFARSSYHEQRGKLVKLVEQFKEKWGLKP
jgi:hypothetical protein